MRREEFEHVIRAAAAIVRDEIVAHGVGPETAIAPAGWEQRLVRLELPAIRRRDGTVIAWCLEVHDLVLAKLAAGRPHDVEFVEEAIRARRRQRPAVLGR